MIWTIKDSSIGTTFFDSGAAKFFLQRLASKGSEANASGGADGVSSSYSNGCHVYAASKRMRYRMEGECAADQYSFMYTFLLVISSILSTSICIAMVGGCSGCVSNFPV